MMRAALLSGPGTVEVVSMETPVPKAGQVLVRVEANALCGTDLKAYRGHYVRGRFPTVLGHELAGTVVESGDQVSDPLLGQRVCVEPNVCCGLCEYCTAGLPNLCRDYHVLGESLEFQGGCAEFVAVAASQVYVLPPSVSAVEGALVQPLAISYEAVIERGKVKSGESVLVVGGGPIGLGSMLLARLQGARVLVADVVEHRVAKALELGADVALRSDLDDLHQAVMDWTDGKGADISIEAVGGSQSSSLRDALGATAHRGRVVVVGGFATDMVPFPMNDLKNFEQSLLGSHGHPGTFKPVIDLMAEGRLRPGDMITHTVGLDGLAGVLEQLDHNSDEITKAVVVP
jgi:L-iditol 2-dehydrogenase